MSKNLKYSLLGILFLLLFLVRGFEDVLFYDPFTLYFQNDYLTGEYPKIDFSKLVYSLVFRFSLNAVISIFILKLIFVDKAQISFLIKLYVVFLIVFASVFLFQVHLEFNNGYLLPFYVRRFLIHPMLLIVLIPVLYIKRKLLEVNR